MHLPMPMHSTSTDKTWDCVIYSETSILTPATKSEPIHHCIGLMDSQKYVEGEMIFYAYGRG